MFPVQSTTQLTAALCSVVKISNLKSASVRDLGYDRWYLVLCRFGVSRY